MHDLFILNGSALLLLFTFLLLLLLLHHDCELHLWSKQTGWGCRDPNTLFRGNSLLSKLVDELMKLVGLPYLHDTLKVFIDKVCGFVDNYTDASS